MTDIEIVEAIRKGGTTEERAMIYLCNNKVLQKKAKYFFRRSGLRLAGLEDVFDESFVRLVSNIRTHSYDENRSLSVYFGGICGNVCKEMRQKEIKEAPFPVDAPIKRIKDVQTPYEIMHTQEQKDALRAVLKLLTDKCRQGLILWAQKYSNKEIAHIMKFNNAAVVGTTLMRCKKKLRTYVMNNPELLKILKESRWL